MINIKEALRKKLCPIIQVTYKDNTKKYFPITKYVELICDIYNCSELRELLLSYGVNMYNIIDIEISYCCDVLESIKKDNLLMIGQDMEELEELLKKNRTKISSLCVTREITDIKDKKTGDLIISTLSEEVVQLHQFVHKDDVIIQKRIEPIDTYIVKIVIKDRIDNSEKTHYLSKQNDRMNLVEDLRYATRYVNYDDAVRDFVIASKTIYISDYQYSYIIINLKDSDSYELI